MVDGNYLERLEKGRSCRCFVHILGDNDCRVKNMICVEDADEKLCVDEENIELYGELFKGGL